MGPAKRTRRRVGGEVVIYCERVAGEGMAVQESSLSRSRHQLGGLAENTGRKTVMRSAIAPATGAQNVNHLTRRCSEPRAVTNRQFELHKRRQFFIRVHNQTLSVVAVCVCNPNRSPVG